MEIGGCQGRDKTPTLTIKKCPECGNQVEVFSIDPEVECEKCGFIVRNDMQSCIQWCKYARLCFGDEIYSKLKRDPITDRDT